MVLGSEGFVVGLWVEFRRRKFIVILKLFFYFCFFLSRFWFFCVLGKYYIRSRRGRVFWEVCGGQFVGFYLIFQLFGLCFMMCYFWEILWKFLVLGFIFYQKGFYYQNISFLLFEGKRLYFYIYYFLFQFYGRGLLEKLGKCL